MSSPRTVMQWLMWPSPKNLESHGLHEVDYQVCPTQMAYWTKIMSLSHNQGRTLNDILMRAEHWMVSLILAD